MIHVDYGSLDPFLGTMKDFDLLVAEMHKRGMRLIMDGVFNHIGDDSIYFDRYSKYKTVGAYEYWSRIYDLMNTKHMKEDAAKVEAKKQLEAEGQVFSPYHWENWFEIKNQKGTDEMGPKYMYHDWQGYSSLVPFKDADYPGSEPARRPRTSATTCSMARMPSSRNGSVNGLSDAWRLDVAKGGAPGILGGYVRQEGQAASRRNSGDEPLMFG
jgi:hypothetical protein